MSQSVHIYICTKCTYIHILYIYIHTQSVHIYTHHTKCTHITHAQSVHIYTHAQSVPTYKCTNCTHIDWHKMCTNTQYSHPSYLQLVTTMVIVITGDKQQLQEGGFILAHGIWDSPSWLLYHGSRTLRSPCICSQESERGGFSHSTALLVLFHSGSHLVEWCHPHVGGVNLAQKPVTDIQGLAPMVILNPTKLTMETTNQHSNSC